ncbi:MAG: glycosyl transferase [Bacteroidales bacterium]|nr:glycosyl transferase [Lachnoclostridium sp.]MCM1384123.1 glycosyl transferase [Lachnoclostridium sp.]MCM1465683.1 glycosyl transferase [Bacteroidales bacterium]
MSIPKKIHYCWFGNNPLPDKVKMCIESWRRYCPDYEIICWNEKNYDVYKIDYIREAYKAGKWAFVSDYARLDIIFTHGGIYLDTDVELLKSLDGLLGNKMFLAIEKGNCHIATGLGFGAEKENLWLGELMKIYQKLSFILKDGSYNLTPCPQYTTQFFLNEGFCVEDRTQEINDVLILSSEYFCPMDYHTGIIHITAHTYGIHWYEASWQGTSDRKIHWTEIKIMQCMPNKLGILMCAVYRNVYRFLEYTKEGILLEKIKRKLKKIGGS